MEQVVLVNEEDVPVGVAPKATVHGTDTPLHRGFSVFVFNGRGEVLVTTRARVKRTFPGVRTNSVCGHPGPDETYEAAAIRRLADEMRLTDVSPRIVSPYRYRFADRAGVVENEICPILIGITTQRPTPNPDEVDTWQWMGWEALLTDMRLRPDAYSPWSREEAAIIDRIGAVPTDR